MRAADDRPVRLTAFERACHPGYYAAFVETRYYPGARHELLNETNRDEVTADVLGWVGKVV